MEKTAKHMQCACKRQVVAIYWLESVGGTQVHKYTSTYPGTNTSTLIYILCSVDNVSRMILRLAEVASKL